MKFAEDGVVCCRAEGCIRGLGIHPPHEADDGAPIEEDGTLGGAPPWQRRDGDGLMLSVWKVAATSRPTFFENIYQGVLDDYGSVSERTVSRYLEKLVKTRRVLAVEVDLPFQVYLEPTSKWLRDLEGLREYVLTERDTKPFRDGGDHDFAIRDRRTSAAIAPDELAEWLAGADRDEVFRLTMDGHPMTVAIERAARRLDAGLFRLTCAPCELDRKIMLSERVVRAILEHGRGL